MHKDILFNCCQCKKAHRIANVPLAQLSTNLVQLTPQPPCSLLGPIYIQRLQHHCDIAASLLPNLIYCFLIVLLHLATVMSPGNHFVSHLGAMRSNIAEASLSLDVNGLLELAMVTC